MRWREIRIDDIGKIITGNTPPRKHPEYYGSAYKFIKPTDIELGTRFTPNPEECYSTEGYEKYKNSLIPPLSTCVVTIGSIGKKITLTQEDCFVNQAVNAVIPDQEKFDPFFVFYLLKNSLDKVKIADTGASSGRENVSKSNFSSLKVETPESKTTQEKIASILSAYDDLIENNLKRIKLLEEATQNIYKEWFVNFRYHGHENTKLENGLPKGWKLKRADELFNINIGKTPPRKQSEWFDENEGVKWISIRDINDSFIYVLNTSERITEQGVKKFNINIAKANTVILSFKLTVGKVAITSEDMITNEAIAHFNRINPDEMGNEFLFCYLKSFEYDTLGGTSSIGKALNSKMVKAMPILHPEKEILRQFEKTSSVLFKQIRNLLLQNQKLKEARDILLPRLMNQTIEV